MLSKVGMYLGTKVEVVGSGYCTGGRARSLTVIVYLYVSVITVVRSHSRTQSFPLN